MAESKRYFWLKLKEDFFEDDSINWIEEQPKGKEYCLFYLKLCLKALKTNGVLIRQVGEMLIPYDAKKLAEITNTDIDTVVVAIELLTRAKLLTVQENGALYMNQLDAMVGSESKWAEKKRLQRAKEDNVLALSQLCPTELEKEKEKDIEKEDNKPSSSPSWTIREAKKMCMDFSQNKEVQELLCDYLEVRKIKKHPNTERAVKLFLKKIAGYSVPVQVEAIEKAIEGGYSSFYPKDNKNDFNDVSEHSKLPGTWGKIL